MVFKKLELGSTYISLAPSFPPSLTFKRAAYSEMRLARQNTSKLLAKSKKREATFLLVLCSASKVATSPSSLKRANTALPIATKKQVKARSLHL